jgi:HEPN domain-containing protein
MSKFAAHEVEYVRWQNRAFRFFVGARLLANSDLHSPAVYSAAIAIELLLKATLLYWDHTFDPLDAGHGIAKLARMVRNKARNAKHVAVPEYFYFEQRYLTVARYPSNGKGFVVPPSFIEDLDRVFAELVVLVPFQHNTELKRALAGKDFKSLSALRRGNRQMRKLRQAMQA